MPEWMEGTDYSHIRAPRRTYNADGSVDMAATRARMEAARAAEPDSALLQLVVPTRHADSVDRAWRGVVFRDGWKYVALEGEPWLLFNLEDDECEPRPTAFRPRGWSVGSERRAVPHRRRAEPGSQQRLRGAAAALPRAARTVAA